MTLSHYHHTAYNSQRIPPQPRPYELSWAMKKLNRATQTPLNHTKANSSVPRQLYESYTPSEYWLDKENHPDWKAFWNEKDLTTASYNSFGIVYYYLSAFSWVTVTWLTGFAFLSVLIAIYGAGETWEGGGEFLIWWFSYIFPLPFIIWVTGKIPFTINIIARFFGGRREFELNRQTGMVTLFNRHDKVRYSHPFIEFDAVLTSTPNHQGILFYSLALVHRYRDYRFGVPLGKLISSNQPEDHRLLWNVIQRYMDTSQPLPDLLILEESRPNDPTTAEYDKQTGRQPDYWRSMSDMEYELEIEQRLEQQSPYSGVAIDIFEPDKQQST